MPVCKCEHLLFFDIREIRFVEPKRLSSINIGTMIGSEYK